LNIERTVRVIAGLFILLTLALGVEASPLFHNVNWLWVTAFVGFNLFQSGLTCFCPLDTILKNMGVKSGSL